MFSRLKRLGKKVVGFGKRVGQKAAQVGAFLGKKVAPVLDSVSQISGKIAKYGGAGAISKGAEAGASALRSIDRGASALQKMDISGAREALSSGKEAFSNVMEAREALRRK